LNKLTWKKCNVEGKRRGAVVINTGEQCKFWVPWKTGGKGPEFPGPCKCGALRGGKSWVPISGINNTFGTERIRKLLGLLLYSTLEKKKNWELKGNGGIVTVSW